MNRPSRVVVVEDEEADIIFLTKAFERGAMEHEVTACRNGDEFFAHLEQCHEDDLPPDIVLLDLNLPVMSGFDILKRIRTGNQFRSLIVIVFTSSAYRREISAAYAAGANAFVTKPARLAELDQLVRSIEEFWFTAGQPAYW
jgi:CheY-like chemotaxis protein